MASKRTNESEMKKELEKRPKRGKNCDVLICVGEDSFPACKDVLMLRMEYFQSMFNSQSFNPIIQLDPEIVDRTIFEDFLDYVYTFDITFSLENLEPLCRAADHFCFDELKTKAEDFMKSNINMSNIALFMNISTKFSLKAKQECQQFLISNSPLDPQARKAVGYLDYSEMTSLLQKLYDDKKFEDMFHLSIDWILHDNENRSKRVSELLQKIPLGRLSTQFCNTVISKNARARDLVMNDNECTKLLLESVIAIPAIPPVEELYVFGGCDGGTQLESVSKYDTATREWHELSPMPQSLSSFGYCVVNQKIYVCGGLYGQQNMNGLYMFNTNTYKWITLKAMKHRRYGCSMAELNGNLYVAGGTAGGTRHNDKRNSLSTVERYSIQDDEWQEVSSMNHKRQGLELVQMNGFLYALGGFHGTDVKAIEQYNPKADKWTILAEMNFPHDYFGSAVLNNRIHVVGKDFYEEYNSEEDKWQLMDCPKNILLGRRLAMFDGQLHVFGGITQRNSDNDFLRGEKNCEYYDIEEGSWIETNDMDTARCYHGVAVIRREYTPK